MTRISETIKYYERIAKKIGVVTMPTHEFKLRCDRIRDMLHSDSKMIAKETSYEQRISDLYLGEPQVHAKIEALKLIKEAIGNVDLTDEYLKIFIYGFKSFPFNTPYEKMLQKVRLIYELSKDTKMKTEDLSILIDLYHSGAYTLMYEQIISLIKEGKEIESGLKLIIGEALKYGLEEAKKLDYLKEEYDEKFIKRIQTIMKKECISLDKVLEILPSKEFIDLTTEEVPGLGYTIKSAEDLVSRRLEYIRVEKDFQVTSLDKKIPLGFTSYGEIVYTSFTKGEYEEELKSRKKLIRKK